MKKFRLSIVQSGEATVFLEQDLDRDPRMAAQVAYMPHLVSGLVVHVGDGFPIIVEKGTKLIMEVVDVN